MPTLTLSVEADPSTGWAVAWAVDDRPATPGRTIPAADVKAVTELAQRFDGLFGHGTRPLVPPAALDHVGRALHQAFVGPDAAALAPHLAAPRVVVRSAVPVVLNLPWELLPLGRDGTAVGCDPGRELVRALPNVGVVTDTPPAGPLRVLFVAAAPEDQKPLDFEKEEDAILTATGGVVHIGELGTVKELAALVRQVRPHVVHLSGHGVVKDGVGVFCFEDEEGNTDAVPAGQLVTEVFAGAGVRCVFLNACQTAQAAAAGVCQELIRAGLPLAVGWAASVADDRATVFAAEFYKRVGVGESAGAALAHARDRIRADGAVSGHQDATFALPQLYTAAPDGRLYDPTRPPETYTGPQTTYQLLAGGVEGLTEGFIGRRREQQRLIPALRKGDVTVGVLCGVGGQGKSTLATRVANRLAADGFRVIAVKSVAAKGESAADCGRRTVTALLTEFQSYADAQKHQKLADLIAADISADRKLSALVDLLREQKVLLVLDNFEDVQDLTTRAIADPTLAGFVGRLMTHLTAGSRVLITTRYVPEGVPTGGRLVRVCETLGDFKPHEFLKFIRRDETLAPRLHDRDLSVERLRRLHKHVGGTPRFLTTVRTLLRKYKAEDLERELEGTAGKLTAEREKYLAGIFAPKLFALLTPPTQQVLTRLALSELALPPDGVAAAGGVDEPAAESAVAECVGYGLLQEFRGGDEDTRLYLPPGVWRGWLTAADRLTEADRLATHKTLAGYWREVYEKDRERELRIRVSEGLTACRAHATACGWGEQFRWATIQLARAFKRLAEFRDALGILTEVPEPDRDMQCWHDIGDHQDTLGEWKEARTSFQRALAVSDGSREAEELEARILHNLAIVDMNEGKYADARDKSAQVLAICQRIGNVGGEAATWHQLASVDVHEGKYADARDKFARALAIKQRIGDVAGEAATWHQLASVDVHEGKYADARDKSARTLAICQRIGDVAGESATWHSLASVAVHEGKYADARDKFARALAIKQRIGDVAGEAATWHSLATVDVHEGKYADARDKFARALAIRQRIGDVAGEANTWHNLASVDMNEGKYTDARVKFASAQAILHRIGDVAGEAATWHQLGMLASNMGHSAEGARLVGLCFLLDNSIGHGDSQQDLQTFLGMCSQLSYTEPQVRSLLDEIKESYLQDRGQAMLAAAFPDA